MFRQPTQPPPKSSAANKSHCMCTCICQPCNLAGTLSSSLMRWIAFIWVKHLHSHRLSQREPTEPKHCCEYSIIPSASKSVSRPHEGSRCSGEKTETSFHRHPACHGFFFNFFFFYHKQSYIRTVQQVFNHRKGKSRWCLNFMTTLAFGRRHKMYIFPHYCHFKDTVPCVIWFNS